MCTLWETEREAGENITKYCQKTVKEKKNKPKLVLELLVKTYHKTYGAMDTHRGIYRFLEAWTLKI